MDHQSIEDRLKAVETNLVQIQSRFHIMSQRVETALACLGRIYASHSKERYEGDKDIRCSGCKTKLNLDGGVLFGSPCFDCSMIFCDECAEEHSCFDGDSFEEDFFGEER